MSRFFVDPSEREPIYEFDPNEVISDRPPNIVWIRPRMSIALRAKAQSAMLAMAKGGDVEADFSKPQIALAQLNILDWEGPDFVDGDGKKIPCNAQNIARLVGSDPFINRVLKEINDRNTAAPSPDPKSAASNGSTTAGDMSLVILESATTA